MMSKPEFIIGIDPGLKGALTLLNPDGELVECTDTPTLEKGKFLHESDLDQLLCFWKFLHKRVVCFIENIITPVYVKEELGLGGIKVKSGQSVKAVRTTSINFGIQRGLLVSNDIYYEIVDPVIWTAIMFEGLPKPKRKNSKARSYFACKTYYPAIDLVNSHKKHREQMDGRADSALIARYGWASWNSRKAAK